MLLARPLCHILEPIVARESKSLPTPGLEEGVVLFLYFKTHQKKFYGRDIF